MFKSLNHYLPFYKRNLMLALPVIMSQVGQITVSLVDTMMIGHVGTVELAASAFANNVFMFGMFFGMGITYGITPVTGEAYGKGHLKELLKWLKNGIYTHIVIGVVFTILLLSMYFLLPYMGQTEQVVAQAKSYYLLLCLSYIPFLFFFSIKQFLEGIGNTKYAMQITIISNVVNIIVNYIFIFGKFGFPELGLIGAGIGTLVARLMMPVLWFIYFGKLHTYRRYFVLAHYQLIEWKRIKKLLSIGIPIGVQIVIEISAFGVGAIMMGWIGEIELAAHSVAIGLAAFTYMISLGISQATTIRVSHQMGLKDYESLKSAAMASTHLVLLCMGLAALLFVTTRDLLPLVFTEDTAVITIASQLLIVAAIFQLFDGLQVIMLSVLRGMSDVKIPMFIAVLAYICIALPTSYVMAFTMDLGPEGIWYGYLVGLGTAGILFYLRFNYIFQKTINSKESSLK